MSFDVVEVRAALAERVEELLARYPYIEFRIRGKNLRLKECPLCRERASRGSVSVNRENGKWNHFGHECSGGAFELLGAIEGLDPRSQFLDLLELGARLTGISSEPLDYEERERRRRVREADAVLRRAREAEERRERADRAHVMATEHWGSLSRTDPAGEGYLKTRGLLDFGQLVERDLVRFGKRDIPDRSTFVCVPLFAFDGRLVNVAMRRIGNSEPKAVVMKDCPTEGTLVGSTAQLTETVSLDAASNGHGRLVVHLTEGIVDTLTSVIRWPHAVTLGANGKGELLSIAEQVAPRIAELGGQLVVIPHEDARDHALEVGQLALQAGLQLGDGLIFIEPPAHGHKDLNVAHVVGWSP